MRLVNLYHSNHQTNQSCNKTHVIVFMVATVAIVSSSHKLCTKQLMSCIDWNWSYHTSLNVNYCISAFNTIVYYGGVIHRYHILIRIHQLFMSNSVNKILCCNGIYGKRKSLLLFMFVQIITIYKLSGIWIPTRK